MWESAMPIKSCASDVVAQIQENFDIHEIHANTLDTYGVRFDIASNSLIFPVHSGTGHLVGVHRLTCTIPEENDNVRVVQGSLLPKSGVLGLFGLNTLTKDVQELVLTSNEWDAMAVYQETKAPALSLPSGISALPQELLPNLERFSKLILWFGDDVRAWEAAKLFAKKLNDKRCCIIRPSVEDPSPFEALRRGVKVRSVLGKARPVKHKSIVSFAQLREEIFSELTHSEQVAGVKWRRYTAMNRLLKGHRRGELTVFTGPTGSGKTTFISDYSLDLCMQGVNTLWGSFEINNVRLGKMMLTQFSQMNLSKRLEEFDEWANRFEELPMYFMTFFGQESIRKVIEAMSHAVYVHDIAHVIVDNLQFMIGSNGEWADRFAKQDTFIAAFRKFATNMNCHVTLVIHPRKEKDTDDLTTASVFGSAKATQEADNVLILQDKRLSSVRGRKYLQVTKNRFDGELGVMLLKFDKESLSFAVREKPAKRATKGDTSAEDIPSEIPVSMSDDADFPSGGI
ncbi:twinkle mtDNA helicase-like [Babylonia areolata]|uniref:twinkle mtDNA helicase-like n=1 Tax=Babylonia areolata TaxID=304850 RepID=UPI003FD1C520